MLRIRAAAVLLATMALVACDDGDDGDRGPTGPVGPAGVDGANNERTTISLSLLGTAQNPAAEFDESAAEIVTFDPTSQNMFVVNANSGEVDIFSLAAPATPTFSSSLDVAGDVAGAVTAVAAAGDLGAANSVDVDSASNTLAVAIAADAEGDPGYVAFYQASDGTFLNAVQVGFLPDMLTFTPDGSQVVVANEGEPNADFSVDPVGSVSIIDMSSGAAALTDADVTTAGFESFNSADLGDVRVFIPTATVAQDLEPEYVAVSADSSTAYVALQENSAVAVVNLTTGVVTDIYSLGFKNHRLPGNELDASDDDGDTINIRNWPIFGIYMPDAIEAYEFNGRTYIVTANEGDARDRDTDVADQAACIALGGFVFDDGECITYTDELDLADLVAAGATLNLPAADIAMGFDADGDGDVDATDLLDDAALGRYGVTLTNGLSGATCDINDGPAFINGTVTCQIDALYGYGARSFSIFDAETGQLVFDSGSDFERITAERLGANFNSDNDENQSGDSRSDAKGPEPEAIELAEIGGRTYAFIGLERVGGIMVYDISEPENASFVQYITTRDFTSTDVETDNVDQGPEGVKFVPAADSPNGNALLLVGNEVSGTINVFQVSSIAISE